MSGRPVRSFTMFELQAATCCLGRAAEPSRRANGGADTPGRARVRSRVGVEDDSIEVPGRRKAQRRQKPICRLPPSVAATRLRRRTQSGRVLFKDLENGERSFPGHALGDLEE